MKWWSLRLANAIDAAQDLHAAGAKLIARASVVVVTDDSGLRARCRHGAGSHADVHFASSKTLVELLNSADLPEGVVDSCSEEQDSISTELSSGASEEIFYSPSASVEDVESLLEVTRREQWLRVEIRKARQSIKHGCSKKKRTKLNKSLVKLEERLDQLRLNELRKYHAAPLPRLVPLPHPPGFHFGVAHDTWHNASVARGSTKTKQIMLPPHPPPWLWVVRP